HEGPRQLARAVGAEVEEDRGIAITHRRARSDDVRLEKLVAALRLRVARAERLLRGRDARRVAIDDRAVRALDAIPPLVAVHRVIATVHSRDPCWHARKKLERAPRWHVAAVEERMHDDVLNLLPSRELDGCREVLHVGVHTTGRDEAHEVKGTPAANGRGWCAERAVGYGRFVLYGAGATRD